MRLILQTIALLVVFLGSFVNAHKYTKHPGMKINGTVIANHLNLTSARHGSMYCKATTGCRSFNVEQQNGTTTCELLRNVTTTVEEIQDGRGLLQLPGDVQTMAEEDQGLNGYGKCLFMYLFIHSSIYLFIYLFIYLSIYLSVYSSIYLFIYLHPTVSPGNHSQLEKERRSNSSEKILIRCTKDKMRQRNLHLGIHFIYTVYSHIPSLKMKRKSTYNLP